MKKVELIPEKLSYEVTEELNTLRTNIQFAGVDKKVIMITSCMSGEGKSNTAFRLACSLAELGKKVILVDADMRKSVMVRVLKRSGVGSGLSHYLSGQCTLADAIYATDVRGMHMLFAGPVPPNPTELLSSKQFENMMSKLRELYDYILVDCAPLGMVVDAAIVSQSCDASILLIEANNIKYRFAQMVKEKLEATGCPILGVVLNKVNRSKNSGYYEKYYGKYYGKYYSHYENGEKQSTGSSMAKHEVRKRTASPNRPRPKRSGDGTNSADVARERIRPPVDG